MNPPALTVQQLVDMCACPTFHCVMCSEKLNSIDRPATISAVPTMARALLGQPLPQALSRAVLEALSFSGVSGLGGEKVLIEGAWELQLIPYHFPSSFT